MKYSIRGVDRINAQNTTRKTNPRTRQTKGSTSSKSSAFGSVFALFRTNSLQEEPDSGNMTP